MGNRIFVRFEAGQIKSIQHTSDDMEPQGADWKQVDLPDDNFVLEGASKIPKRDVLKRFMGRPENDPQFKPVVKKERWVAMGDGVVIGLVVTLEPGQSIPDAADIPDNLTLRKLAPGVHPNGIDPGNPAHFSGEPVKGKKKTKVE